MPSEILGGTTAWLRLAFRSLLVLPCCVLACASDTASEQQLEAQSIVSRAEELFETRQPDALLESAALFADAVALDDSNPLAYAGLASSSCLLALYSTVPPQEVLRTAERAARRAIELDPELAQAYAALGLVEYLHRWNWARAEELFAESIARDPGAAEVRHWYAMMLMALGRNEEAVESITKAGELDPRSRIIAVKRGTVLTAAARFEEAERELHRSAERFPSMSLPWRELGFLELQRGLPEKAAEAFERAASIRAESSKVASGLGHSYAVLGRRQEAEAIVGTLLKRSAEGFVPPLSVALVYAGLDQRENAFEWLERAFLIRDPGLVYLAVKPGFGRLRDDPRFAELLARIGLE